MDEAAYAVELARAAAQEMTPEIAAFTGTLLGGPAAEASSMLAEQVRSLRLRQSIKILKRAQRRLRDAGLDPKAVPPRKLVPLLEAASLETDEDMAERWASLLANAAADAAPVHPSFAQALKELEPVEARMLDTIFSTAMQFSPELRSEWGAEADSFEVQGLTAEQVRFHVDNLLRLRLVAGGRAHPATQWRTLMLTGYGQAFVRACRSPGQADPRVVFTDRSQLYADAGVAEGKPITLYRDSSEER